MSRVSNDKRLKGLLCAGLDGDEKAYSKAIGEIYVYVRRCAHGTIWNDALADDVAQEAMIVLCKKLPSVWDRNMPLCPLIDTVVKNKYLDARRKISRREIREEREGYIVHAGSVDGYRPDEILEKADSSSNLRASLESVIDQAFKSAAIPDDTAALLIGHHMRGVGIGVLAKENGLKPGAARVRMHRARVKLADLFGLSPDFELVAKTSSPTATATAPVSKAAPSKVTYTS